MAGGFPRSHRPTARDPWGAPDRPPEPSPSSILTGPTQTPGYTNDIQIRAGEGGPRWIYKTLELIRKNLGTHSIFVLQLG